MSTGAAGTLSAAVLNTVGGALALNADNLIRVSNALNTTPAGGTSITLNGATTIDLDASVTAPTSLTISTAYVTPV